MRWVISGIAVLALLVSCRETGPKPVSAAEHFEFGQMFYAAGKWQNARASFRAAIDKDPKHTEAYIGLAYTLFELGKMAGAGRELSEQNLYHNQAIWYFDQALQVDPENAEAFYGKGLVFFERHRFADALVFFRECQARQPDRPEVHFYLGAVYAYLGTEVAGNQEEYFARDHFRMALGHYDRYLRLIPDAPDEQHVLSLMSDLKGRLGMSPEDPAPALPEGAPEPLRRAAPPGPTPNRR